MTDAEIIQHLADLGCAVDEGMTIGGPFIPDGRVRVFREDSLDLLAEGASLQEAFEDFLLNCA